MAADHIRRAPLAVGRLPPGECEPDVLYAGITARLGQLGNLEVEVSLVITQDNHLVVIQLVNVLDKE